VDQRLEQEISRCATDFRYFCQHLSIVDKKGRMIPFTMNEAQEKFVSHVEENPWTYILKARQLGMTTMIAARFFWRALFTPNFRVGVLAHRTESAQAIFEIYKRFYENLPAFLKFPTEKANVRELSFFHGGYIRVTTANSENFRGTTYQALHCSEFAFWGDVERAIASAFQTAGPNAEIYLETTANGMNDAHRLWRDQSGFAKLFFPWMDDSAYVASKPKGGLNPKIKEYAKEFGLTEKQANWAHNTYMSKCMGNWNTFLQEYPATAEQAFISSGETFFDTVYPHVQLERGYRNYIKPSKFRVYSLGVDVASGSPSGDFSSFCVMDVTDKKAPTVCSTFYERMPPHAFSERVRMEAIKYNALVVVESNSYGLSVLEHLMGNSYAYIFKRTQYDKMAERWVEKVGFSTNVSTRPVMLSRLHEYISKKWLVPTDDRMKFEMNTFIYNDRGKPEAAPKKHDDMIFAYALTLMGLDQIEQVKDDVQSTRPSNLREMLQFELNTGKVFKKADAKKNTDRWGVPLSMPSLMDTSGS
tara:strand:+ start:4701 stop:6290 length:1590 start_codon:yes stop_codon:yes gene_type:complete